MYMAAPRVPAADDPEQTPRPPEYDVCEMVDDAVAEVLPLRRQNPWYAQSMIDRRDAFARRALFEVIGVEYISGFPIEILLVPIVNPTACVR